MSVTAVGTLDETPTKAQTLPVPIVGYILLAAVILTIMFDTKKITSTPKDQWEAINFLVKKEQELISALHIMKSIIDNPQDDFKELHEKRIKEFLSNYELSD